MRRVFAFFVDLATFDFSNPSIFLGGDSSFFVPGIVAFFRLEVRMVAAVVSSVGMEAASVDSSVGKSVGDSVGMEAAGVDSSVGMETARASRNRRRQQMPGLHV